MNTRTRPFVVFTLALGLAAFACAGILRAEEPDAPQLPLAGPQGEAPPPRTDRPATRTPRLSPRTAPHPDQKPEQKGETLPRADAAPPRKPAAADPPPDTPTQRRRALDDLYAHLATTENAGTAAPLVAAIERLWLYSGSDTIDVLMERVLKAVAEQKFDLAAKLSDSIVELEPGFSEGWNRRALVAYLQGDQENALNALHRALALEPNHFKALDGLAQIMREQGNKKGALDAYRRLVAIDPFWEGAQEAVDQLKREVEGDGI